MALRRVVLVSGVTAIAIFGLAHQASSPARPWKLGPAQALEPERVRIEQEIVRIPVTITPPVRVVSAGAASRTAALRRPKVSDNSSPTVRLTARDESPDPGLVSRAVKKIVGAGRYTPQPFPRVKDEEH